MVSPRPGRTAWTAGAVPGSRGCGDVAGASSGAGAVGGGGDGGGIRARGTAGRGSGGRGDKPGPEGWSSAPISECNRHSTAPSLIPK